MRYGDLDKLNLEGIAKAIIGILNENRELREENYSLKSEVKQARLYKEALASEVKWSEELKTELDGYKDEVFHLQETRRHLTSKVISYLKDLRDLLKKSSKKNDLLKARELGEFIKENE